MVLKGKRCTRRCIDFPKQDALRQEVASRRHGELRISGSVKGTGVARADVRLPACELRNLDGPLFKAVIVAENSDALRDSLEGVGTPAASRLRVDLDSGTYSGTVDLLVRIYQIEPDAVTDPGNPPEKCPEDTEPVRTYRITVSR